jgi:GIY-YIG catalytic domain
MPRDNIDYSKTVFYKIVCKDITIPDCYVGSTTNFTKRKHRHKSNSINQNAKEYNYYLYRFIRDNGGWDNFSMVEIESKECSNSNEAHSYERKLMEQLKATLNKQIPTRTALEYRQMNQDKIVQYRIDNRDKLLEYSKKYHAENRERLNQQKRILCDCLCGGRYTMTHKANHMKTKKHQRFIKQQDEPQTDTESVE